MDKVICDICGTAYPETEEKCPLCGCTKEFAMDLVGTGVAESKVVQTNKAAEPAARKKNKEIFDFDVRHFGKVYKYHLFSGVFITLLLRRNIKLFRR